MGTKESQNYNSIALHSLITICSEIVANIRIRLIKKGYKDTYKLLESIGERYC